MFKALLLLPGLTEPGRGKGACLEWLQTSTQAMDRETEEHQWSAEHFGAGHSEVQRAEAHLLSTDREGQGKPAERLKLSVAKCLAVFFCQVFKPFSEAYKPRCLVQPLGCAQGSTCGSGSSSRRHLRLAMPSAGLVDRWCLWKPSYLTPSAGKQTNGCL